MNKKYLMAFASLFALAACETAPTDGADGMGGGMMDPNNPGYDQYGNPIPGTQADLVANVGDRVFFALDSSSLSSEAMAVLDKQAAWLRQHGNVNVIVEGHADERGTREYNLALGERRATAAKRYLVNSGVAERRITTISYGKERPAVVGSNESAWGQNRRAVTVVVSE